LRRSGDEPGTAPLPWVCLKTNGALAVARRQVGPARLIACGGYSGSPAPQGRS
jgi:hypothetical protein